MALDAETIKNIAFLARLKIPEDDIEPLKDDLNKILEWINQLSEVDTEGVEPMTSVVAMKLNMRIDEICDGQCREEVLANSPGKHELYFTVPKVVEQDD